MARVVVIGAGIAGLACAFRLARSGHEVEVLEREDLPGGRMKSQRHGKFLLDRGAGVLSSADRNLTALAAQAGVARELVPLEVSAYAVLRAGSFQPADWHSPAALARSKLLSLRAKARLSRALLKGWRTHGEPLAAGLVPGDPADCRDLASHLQERVGEEAAEQLLLPVLAPVGGADPAHLSGGLARLALEPAAGIVEPRSFQGGNGRLPRALADQLNVRVGWEVSQVECDELGVQVHYVIPSGERSLRAEAAVLAVPATEVARLCPQLTPDERDFFEQARCVRGVTASLFLEKAPAIPFARVSFPRSQGVDLQVVHLDHWKPGAAPAGAGLVRVVLGAAAATRWFEARHERVIDCVQAELAKTPIGALDATGAVVERWDPMLPLFYPGSLGRLAGFLGRRERSARLAFAGDHLAGPSVEGAVTSGLRAAAEVEVRL